MPNQPLIENGQPDVIEECQRCGMPNAKGISYIRTGRKIFWCQECGRNSDMGFLEEAHKKQLQSIQDKERAVNNRDRYQRENQEKQTHDYRAMEHEIGYDPSKIFNLDYLQRKI